MTPEEIDELVESDLDVSAALWRVNKPEIRAVVLHLLGRDYEESKSSLSKHDLIAIAEQIVEIERLYRGMEEVVERPNREIVERE